MQGLLGVVALLAVPEYREAVLEGLIASIGGLDASLSKEASAALVATLHASPSGEQPYTSGPYGQITIRTLHRHLVDRLVFPMACQPAMPRNTGLWPS